MTEFFAKAVEANALWGGWQGDEIFRAASRKAFSLNGHIFVESTNLRIVAYLPLSHVTFTKRLQRQSLGRCFSGEREKKASAELTSNKCSVFA